MDSTKTRTGRGEAVPSNRITPLKLNPSLSGPPVRLEAVKKSISRIWREFNRANFCSESPINDVCDVGIHLRSLAKFAKPIFSQLPVPRLPLRKTRGGQGADCVVIIKKQGKTEAPRGDIIACQGQAVRAAVACWLMTHPQIQNHKRRPSMTQTSATQQRSDQTADKNAIRPFHVNDVAEAELTELRRRINATKWPERETVTDQSQGVQLATIQELARYWATDYDWRKIEAKLNALPQFITEIDGLDIHFIHVRSKHENALPMIVTHGWPGSVVEQMKIIDPLTNPTAHGGNASDAFRLVIPSIPGYGYSGKPTTTGWDGPHIARAWVVLMKRLG